MLTLHWSEVDFALEYADFALECVVLFRSKQVRGDSSCVPQKNAANSSIKGLGFF